MAKIDHGQIAFNMTNNLTMIKPDHGPTLQNRNQVNEDISYTSVVSLQQETRPEQNSFSLEWQRLQPIVLKKPLSFFFIKLDNFQTRSIFK